MRTSVSSSSLQRGLASALLAAGFVLTIPDLAVAQDQSTPVKPGERNTSCTCPSGQDERPKLWPKPKFAELKTGNQSKPGLSSKDEFAALEAVHLALTEVGDGSSYVWHQKNGPLSGV